MTKRIEHHQTVLTTSFRIVDDERSYPAPQPNQQVAILLTEAEFMAAMRQIQDYIARLQEELEKENANSDSSD